jgi:double-stranded uracil-DNA glycosylase
MSQDVRSCARCLHAVRAEKLARPRAACLLMKSVSSLALGMPAVASTDARVLILGSIPGLASMHARQYYAHPQNLFWPMLCQFLGISPELSYQPRLRAMQDRKIALWDVLQACERSGSLDSKVRRESMQINEFADFFARHPALKSVICNGKLAAQQFCRAVLPELKQIGVVVQLLEAPSTSPANAAMPKTERIARWHALLAIALDAAAQ